jgi:hypothetical protein
VRRLWWVGCLALTCVAACAAPEVVGSWLLNGDTAGVVADAGPNHLDGRAVGVLQVTGAGEEGLALRFERPGAQVDMPPSDRYACGGGAFTLTLWVRTRQTQPATVLALADPAGAARLRVSLTAGGHLQLELWGPLQPALVSRTSVADGDWHYVSAVYDAPAAEAFLYVDDAFTHSAHLPPGGPTQVALRLGNDFAAERPFRGDLDDLTLTRGIPAEVVRVLARFRAWGVPSAPDVAGPPLPDLNLPATPPQGAELRARLDALRGALAQWLGAAPAAPTALMAAPVEIQELRATPLTVQAAQVRVPVVLVTAAEEEAKETGEAPRHPVVILADPEGKAAALEGRRELLSALAFAGAVSCAVDLSPDPFTAARQLQTVVAYLRSRPDVLPEALLLVCWGADAVPALAAAACDAEITRAVMLDAAGEGLPALLAAAAPCSVWVQGALEPARIVWPVAAYRELAPENLLLTTGPVGSAEIVAWLPR